MVKNPGRTIARIQPCSKWTIWGMLVVMICTSSSHVAAETTLDTIRSDVRSSSAENAPTTQERPKADSSSQYADGQNPYDAICQSTFGPVLAATWFAGTFPAWAPRAVLNDGNEIATFPRFPYDGCQGYLVSSDWPDCLASNMANSENLWQPAQQGPQGDSSDADLTRLPDVAKPLSYPTRRWGGQLRVDYGDEFDNLNSINGQLVLESSTRFGFNTSLEHLRERRFDRSYDNLTLGNWNLLYRVAQHPKAQVQMGLGMNWMTDEEQTDLGFNFTYGVDLFPRKPWVISAALDAGTLGNAGLFRFRTTGGILLNRLEVYTGYEYLDIGSTQSSALLAGLRVWF